MRSLSHIRPKMDATIRRIEFLSEPTAGAELRREFTQPFRAFAVENSVSASAMPAVDLWAEQPGVFWVMCVPANEPAAKSSAATDWLEASNWSEPILSVERNGTSVRWRRRQAVVCGPAERWDDAISALIDFAFLEGELHTLEKAIADREPQAETDVALSFRIRHRDRHEWQRLGDTIEFLGGLRLKLARLEPCLSRPSRQLSAEARQIFARLGKRADIEHRLEALDTRLEALEDLYEGATDRIADYRWYRNGHRLELTIILLLLLEAILMAIDLAVHYWA